MKDGYPQKYLKKRRFLRITIEAQFGGFQMSFGRAVLWYWWKGGCNDILCRQEQVILNNQAELFLSVCSVHFAAHP